MRLSFGESIISSQRRKNKSIEHLITIIEDFFFFHSSRSKIA